VILFYGRPDDAPLRDAIAAARRLGVDHRTVNQLDPRCGERLALADVGAVYARPLAPAGDPAFVEWLDYADALVVNRPCRMRSNASKPWQAQLIARAGFTVPATLVTNDPDRARAFRARHARVVFKSVGGVRSIVTELDDATASRLDRVAVLPTQFQEYVPGVDVRVHVVGAGVFATEVRCDAIDYRYAHRTGGVADLRAVDLPATVADRCVALAAALDLPLCGIDLRRRPDGEHVCFEANPMPAFSYYQAGTGQPIAEALVRLLMRSAAPR